MKGDLNDIDELFKQNLTHPPMKVDEEVAWLKMKALLDEKMPEKRLVYFTWRKTTILLGVALLLGALALGSYELISAYRQEQEKLKESQAQQMQNEHNELSSQLPEFAAKEKAEQDELLQSDSEANTIAELPTGKNTVQQSNQQASSLNKASEPSNALQANNRSKELRNDAEKLSGSQPIAQQTLGNNVPQNSAQRNANTIEVAANQSSVKPVTSPLAQKQAKQRTKQSSSEVEQHKEPAKDAALAVNNTEQKQSKVHDESESNSAEKQQTLSAKASETKVDTIPSFTVVTKEAVSKTFPRKSTIKSDTIYKGNVLLEQKSNSNVLASSVDEQQKEGVSKLKTDPQLAALKEPNAVQKAAQAQIEPKVSLRKEEMRPSVSSSAKTTEKKNGKNSWLPQVNLSEAVQNTKKQLSKATFYAGINFGANQTLSNSQNFLGIQFGPTGELVFDKHWSLFAGLKYFNRSGGAKTINDSYIKESSSATPDSIIGANRFYTVFTDSTHRYFKFSTLHSFELPITVRYTLQKFYVMTGLNLAYYLGVNVEEVQKQYAQVRSHTVATNLTRPILVDNAPLLHTNDFGAKFGVGYVFGFGYRLTPSWHTDVRIANTFWDNASGAGAQKLSKDFYKIPSVQISIGYQFNRDRSKPTFGPNDLP